MWGLSCLLPVGWEKELSSYPGCQVVSCAAGPELRGELPGEAGAT